jgi:lipopolysaccharide kinase (Kdo/WaaP) family protein
VSRNINPLLQFICANFAYMLSGKLRSKKGYQPPAGHAVPLGFAGVGIATAADSAMDAYVIAQLKDLGIHQVRLDFTYGDADNHVARFLLALSAESFSIMLHLVQPLDAAKAMESHAAQEEWQRFVADVLHRFGEKVELVEIGSTINRRRWAGYTLNGFLKAWQIAHDEVRRCNIKLAGPNITDFEPPYNIGLLSIMRSRGQLPDIHTDNLFSERCTEPERDDHKILGHRLAPLGGFRLVKKAFVLQEIGANYCIPELHSPAAFWTLPRIHRLLPDGEQKQADYMTRYMILCAASGALRRASWGPLICHREGLIDDGTGQYPAVERITHYASVTGSIANFRPRPAFSAMKAFAATIPGLNYQGQLNDTDYLEVHAFSSGGHQIHAAWTTNGKAAALADIYAAGNLSLATCASRDGKMLDTLPDLVTESPIYLHFPPGRTVTINPEADIIGHLSLHSHINGQHLLFRRDGWQGLLLAADKAEGALLATALHPASIGEPPADALLRKARNAIWTIADPRDQTRRLVIKQPVRMHLHKKLFDRFKPSKALRSWNGASELLRRGIETAHPVAYFEKPGDTSLTRNYYICEYVDSDFSVRQLFSAFASGEKIYQEVRDEEAYCQLCDFLLMMHGRGVFFRDLSGGNILVKKSEGGKLAFSLIDTGRAHFFNRGTPMDKRISDLTRTCNKLHAEGRDRFMEIYLAKLGRRFGFWQRLPFHLYNAKVVIKRRLKRKNLFRLFKR